MARPAANLRDTADEEGFTGGGSTQPDCQEKLLPASPPIPSGSRTGTLRRGGLDAPVTIWGGETAPLVNALAVAVGASLGAAGLRGLPEGHRTIVLQGVALTVVGLGLSMTLTGTADPLLWTAAIVLGGLVGETLQLEQRLDRFSSRLHTAEPALLSGTSRPQFGEGFMLATLLFCVGPLAILGALRSGLSGSGGLLYAKSLLDGVTAMFLATGMGYGVAVAAVPVLVYEGGIVLGAHLVAPLLIAPAISGLTQVGGLLVAGLGINMLGLARLRVGNLLPSLLFAVMLAAFMPHIG